MRGGSRDNAGRKKIGDQQFKVTLSEEITVKLGKYFPDTSYAKQIRNAIEEAVKLKEETAAFSKKNKLKVLDMFCGCGGLSKGFIDAGYDVVAGIDHDKIALQTFEHNHEGAKGLNIDLFKDNAIDTILEEIGGEEIDVLVGGPPCQGFSLAGNRRENDDRNKLYKSMVEIAKRIKPRAVIIENVPGLATLYNGVAKREIMKDFSDLGYNMVEPQVLYAPDYGIPQIRKRIFFVGLLNSEEGFQYPEPVRTSENYVTCENAIGDLPSLENTMGVCPTPYSSEPLTDYQKQMRKNSKEIRNHLGTKHTSETKHLINLVPEGKNYKALPDNDKLAVDFKSKKRYNESLTRYHSKRPSRTIDTGHRTHFHYKENRIPSVRENARLQSFPDDFVLTGNKQQQYRQVGNAVPPLMGYHLGKQLKKYLEKGEK